MQSEPEQSAIPRKLSSAKVCRNPIGCGLGKKKNKQQKKQEKGTTFSRCGYTHTVIFVNVFIFKNIYIPRA